jgi:hypothetical protein
MAKVKIGGREVTLAKVGDPYITPKGDRIFPTDATGKVIEQAIPPLEPKSFKVRKRRTLRDLPAPIPVMHGVAAVFMYTILGIGDREVAGCLKCSVEDVKGLREHPAYNELFEAVSRAFIDSNSDLIHARIAAMGHAALTSVAQIAINGQKEGDKLKASQDLLNRGGHVAEHMKQANSGMTALRILVVDGSKSLGVEVNGRDVGGIDGYRE